MKIIAFVGCSGSGKNYLAEKLLEKLNQKNINVDFIKSFTTRNIRNGEKDGVDYHFISKENFEEKIKKNEFLEYIEVNGNYYGTPFLSEDKVYLHIIEPKGLENLKQDKRLNVTSVFLKDFSNGEFLKERVQQRIDNALNEEERNQHLKRLKHIEEVEIPEWNKKANSNNYDYVFSIQDLTNENHFNIAINKLTSLVEIEFKIKKEINLNDKKLNGLQL